MGERLQIYVYDAVGTWYEECRAQDVVDLLADHQYVDGIDVYVNSPGGSVFDGMAIYNALERHRADVRVQVDGLAASIASVIVQAGDERVMGAGTSMMIHEPSWGCFGEIAEIERQLEQLRSIRQDIAEVYAARSGTDDVSAWLDLMAVETWFSAREAVAAGLADSVLDAKAPAQEGLAARATNVAQLIAQLKGRKPGDREPVARFGVVPPARPVLVPTNRYPGPDRSVVSPTPTNTTMADQSLFDRLRAKFFPTAADDFDTIQAVADLKAKAARADELEAELETVRAELAEATEAKEQLEAAATEAEAEANEALVDQAVAEFRIEAKDRDKYAADMKADPAATKRVLAALPKDLHNPARGGVEAPTNAAKGGVVSIPRADARDPKKYRAAKAEAKEKGARLEIVD